MTRSERQNPTNSPELDETVSDLDNALRAHAGGLEMLEVTPAGAVTVKFTGMCAGCPMRPLTTAATVRPALLAVNGVTRVTVEGSRISEFAERRLSRAFAATDGWSQHA